MLVQAKSLYGSCKRRNIGFSASPRRQTVSVQKRWEIESITRACMRARKEAVCVLLGTQYGYQCESRRGDSFGTKEGGIWFHDKELCEVQERGCVGAAGDAICVPV